MSVELSWREIALRLALTVLAGALIGFDRGEHGRPAGLRTNMLVCLAAAVAMIQVNLLLGMNGRGGDSFVMLDLMRLPLGILSGMGFIGAGAIIRRDDMVLGVTTAATLWFVTVLGLCFGGGQIGLGLAALAIALVLLGAVKPLEDRLPRQRRATLQIAMGPDGPDEAVLRATLAGGKCRVASVAKTYTTEPAELAMRFDLRWRARPSESVVPEAVATLARMPGVRRVSWQP